ncbi:MFS aflatoxin efflux pump [Trichophyton rubrum]|uniref:MFS aflatoxin efflux pump n=1 Tax=Trichophyton rubrum TaxID=5551 RepID=A0A178EVN9_TRIRU|nr:MFS aflatoxin efflux pump [Trichophyton rubrum]
MASSRAFSPDSTESPVADVPKVASQHCDLTPDFTAKSENSEKQPIIQVAIPRITDEFESLQDVGWYGSAYLLTCCAFQLLFGKLYKLFSVRIIFLCSIGLFEAACAICGAAPNSLSFIVGRAICGIGAAGVLAGTIMCIVHPVPLKKRPQIQGLFGALFGIASVVGPLIGGAFTSNVSWRWCFYINLPIGGVAIFFIVFCLKLAKRDMIRVPIAEKLVQLDSLGTTLLALGVVSLVLALQWGGQAYPVLLPRQLRFQHVYSRSEVFFRPFGKLCIGSGNYIFAYFLPVWFQSIQGTSAVNSGILLLPMMLSMVVGSVGGRAINSRIGYYTPLAIIGSCIMSVGAGFLTTLKVASGKEGWIGYQVIYGFGLGLCFQVPNLAAQTVLSKPDIPLGLALMLFGQLIGAAVFVSVGENVLANQLVKRLSALPGFTPGLVTSGGITGLFNTIPTDQHDILRFSYNEALRSVFQVGLIVSCMSLLGAATLEWKSINRVQSKLDTENKTTGGEKAGQETRN